MAISTSQYTENEYAPTRDRAAGDRDRRHVGAKHDQSPLRQDQADAPGGDQRPELSAVEAAYYQPFQHDAEQSRGEERDDHRQRERDPAVHGERRRVRAQHHELPMREIDEVHHAQDDDQPERAQQ